MSYQTPLEQGLPSVTVNSSPGMSSSIYWNTLVFFCDGAWGFFFSVDADGTRCDYINNKIKYSHYCRLTVWSEGEKKWFMPLWARCVYTWLTLSNQACVFLLVVIAKWITQSTWCGPLNSLFSLFVLKTVTKENPIILSYRMKHI